jgi:23S rRNA (adenine1618-N6)-methyltransferase
VINVEKMKSEKTNLHPNNQHRSRYDFDFLTSQSSELTAFIFKNEHGIETLDFANPNAVKALNRALLASYYNIQNWDLPKDYLCPPIPGRADYLHYISDLLAQSNNLQIPLGNTVSVLDIGVGANCIYPILGNTLFGWNFVASDVDEKALQNCVEIIQNNPHLAEHISLQLQPNPRFIFKDILLSEDKFAFTICNPPFHKSAAEAAAGTSRKITNLHKTALKTPTLNFGGLPNELWCEGGELAFITQMIYESAKYPMQCLWFTTLVSKQSHIKSLEKVLNKVKVAHTHIIEMSQGQKKSRILAWSFLTESQQKEWKFK